MVEIKKSLISTRNRFMRNVIVQVWQRLDNSGRDFNFGQMREGFLRMLENDNVLEEVADVFYDRFISI